MVKALVDSGATNSTMTRRCAESCGIALLIDRTSRGTSSGVGNIQLTTCGEIHYLDIKIGSHIFASNLDILEEGDDKLLIGIDILKRSQACIDLKKDVLIIHGEEVPFLSKADIPNSSRC